MWSQLCPIGRSAGSNVTKVPGQMIDIFATNVVFLNRERRFESYRGRSSTASAYLASAVPGSRRHGATLKE